MSTLLYILIILFVLIGVLYIFFTLKRRSYGAISKKHVYSDAQSMPGQVLYSENLTLKGKPDYIIRSNNMFIPVEVKTGKTPQRPYQNHIMQLIAYCALTEEEYQVRPSHGVIKYPEAEFAIEYTPHREEAMNELIREMLEMKENGTEPTCRHAEHNG